MEEIEELLSELEAVKERLTKLKSQEQAVVDEEEALCAKITKFKQSVPGVQDMRVSRIWSAINAVRPFRTPLLLSLSLGKARFVLPEKQRFRYKREYEQFKLYTVALHFFLCVVQLLCNSIFVDSLSNFHLVYYYSVLTLREQIMVANGSNIRPWWIVHHYLCVLIAGVLLIWPYGFAYTHMRSSLLYFAIYVSGMQVLQYRYQMKRLYTLRAMARVGPMQTTTESATVHIKNDLAFLFPFLVLGHIGQFYLAYMFWQCALRVYTWHLPVLALLFLAIGCGNLSTALYTLIIKYKHQ